MEARDYPAGLHSFIDTSDHKGGDGLQYTQLSPHNEYSIQILPISSIFSQGFILNCSSVEDRYSINNRDIFRCSSSILPYDKKVVLKLNLNFKGKTT